MPRPEILVVATIDAVGVTRLPRILAEAGCDVVLLCARKLAVRRSRFVARWIEGPRDPAAAAEALRAHLEGAAARYRHVIVADEPLLWRLKQEPAPWMTPWFPAPLDLSGVDAVFSKVGFIAAAKQHGVATPESRLCFTHEEARQAADDFGCPVVLKADQGLSGSGVRVSRSRQELVADFATLGGPAGVIAQRFVAGRLGTTSALFDRGRPACWFSAYTLEHWPTPFASSTALRPVVLPGMESLLERLGAMTRFNGLCGLDWVEDPATRRPLFLEMNPRPTPGLYLGSNAGVDFSAAIRGWLAGEPVSQKPRISDRVPEMLPMFPQALYRAVDDRRAALFLAAMQDMPWAEPALALAHLRRLGGHYARRLLRR